jgi:hypothetical protein
MFSNQRWDAFILPSWDLPRWNGWFMCMDIAWMKVFTQAIERYGERQLHLAHLALRIECLCRNFSSQLAGIPAPDVGIPPRQDHIDIICNRKSSEYSKYRTRTISETGYSKQACKNCNFYIAFIKSSKLTCEEVVCVSYSQHWV